MCRYEYVYHARIKNYWGTQIHFKFCFFLLYHIWSICIFVFCFDIFSIFFFVTDLLDFGCEISLDDFIHCRLELIQAGSLWGAGRVTHVLPL